MAFQRQRDKGSGSAQGRAGSVMDSLGSFKHYLLMRVIGVSIGELYRKFSIKKKILCSY